MGCGYTKEYRIISLFDLADINLKKKINRNW